MRRQPKRAPATAQGDFGFTRHSGSPPALRPGDDWFQPDSHEDIYLGGRRLDEYLSGCGAGWIVELRKLLEELDWRLLTRAYHPTGRKAKHPRMMLGLIVYGILSRRWSLRELEELARRDVGAWWVCGAHQPDHSTIGEFIERHAEILTEAFFESLVKWAVRRLWLQVGTAAIDGTVIESAASRFQMLKLEAAREAARSAAQAAQAHPDDTALQAQAQGAAELAAIATRRAQERAARGDDPTQTAVPRTDPEAVLQPRKDGARRPAHKPSVLVHASGLILGHSVHPTNEVAQVDGLLAQHHAVFGAPPQTLLTDANYHCGEMLSTCVAQDIDLLCPSGDTLSSQSWNKRGIGGRFAKSEFAYDAASDTYRCPAGNVLRAKGCGRDRHGMRYTRYRTPACRGCGLRGQCTTATQGRVIDRFDGDEYKELMRRIMEHPSARRKYRQRMTMGERPFAELTMRQGLRRFHRRGRVGVAVEFALHCMAFDLKVALRAALRAPFGAGRRPALAYLLLSPFRAMVTRTQWSYPRTAACAA
jgi:transposase